MSTRPRRLIVPAETPAVLKPFAIEHPIYLRYVGQRLPEDEEASLVAQLADSEAITMTFDQSQDIIWNGIRFVIPAGEHELPSPIAAVWQQSQSDKARVNANPFADDDDWKRIKELRMRERFAKNGVVIV